MKYLSLDLETAGITKRDQNQILMISMVVEDTDKPNVHVTNLPHFTVILDHETLSGEPTALAMNAWLLIAIEYHKTKMSQEDFVVKYSDLGISKETIYKGLTAAITHPLMSVDQMTERANEFLDVHFGTKDKITVSGKNVAGFDMAFLPPALKNRFRHNCIDPTSLFWKPKTDRMLPNTKKVMLRAGVEYEGAHDALEDARMVILALRNNPVFLLEEVIDFIKLVGNTCTMDNQTLQAYEKLIKKINKGEKQ